MNEVIEYQSAILVETTREIDFYAKDNTLVAKMEKDRIIIYGKGEKE